MTISQERTALSATAAGRVEFATARARRGQGCPWIVQGAVARPDGSREQLYLIAEPTEPTARSGTSARFIAAIRDVYAASTHDDPIVALTAAIEAANDALYGSNRSAAPGLRVVLGLTCLLVQGSELIICQVPPTQLILAQGGVPVILPELASWRADYQPHAPGDRQGLGAAETATPVLYRAILEPGDLITLCSTNLARLLADEASDEDLGPLLGSDPGEAAAFLRDLADRHHLDPAFGVAIAPHAGGPDGPAALPERAARAIAADHEPGTGHGGAAGGERWIDRSLREMRDWTRVIHWPRRGGGQIVPLRPRARVAPPEEDAPDELADAPIPFTPDREERRPPAARGRAPLADDLDELDGPDGPFPEPPGIRRDDDEEGWGEPTAAAPDRAPYDDDGDLDEEPEVAPPPARRGRRTAGRRARGGPGQALGSLVALFVLVVGSALERLLPAGGRRRNERFLDRSRSRVWPIGSMERHAAGRPRLGRAVPLLALGAVAVLVVVLILSVRNRQIRGEQQRFDDALDEVARARAAAVAAPDKLAAYNQLLALPERLGVIPGADRPGRPERIAAERASIAVALDQVAGVERLSAASIALVAPLPATGGAIVGRPQLVAGKDQQFALINGIVYSVDGRGKTLTRILGKGDTVGGVSVGQLVGIAWRVDALFAFTETQGFVRGATGWTATPLAATGRKAAAVESFDGNLYFLEPERGQIIKFASGSYGQTPQPWTGTKATTDLGLALDFAIDKDIYILLSDGRILDYYQGELKTSFAPSTVPPIAGAGAIAVAPEGRWLYLLDAKEGRIVRLGRDGTLGGSYKPADGKALGGARDLAVDEATGTLYLLTDEGVVGVKLP